MSEQTRKGWAGARMAAHGRHHRAVLLIDLRSTVEAAYEELRYDDDPPKDVLAALELLKDYEFRV